MALCARPRILFRGRNHSAAHGVQFHIPDRCVGMTLIQDAGEKPALPKVPLRRSLLIVILGILHVNGVECSGKGIGGGRNADKVDMIWHEAISPDFEAILPGIQSEPLQIVGVIVRIAENTLAVITTLRNVVRVTDRYGTRHSWH